MPITNIPLQGGEVVNLPSQPDDSYIQGIAQKYGVPYDVVRRVMTAEGAGPTTRSKAGAIGRFQLLPATAKELGVDPNDPWQNPEGGIHYLQQLGQRFGGDWAKAV